jgi:hypothetical protein
VNKVQVFVTFWLLGTVLLLLVPLHWLQDVLEYIEGMREHDVPYHVRFAIDTGKGSGVGCPLRRPGVPRMGMQLWLAELKERQRQLLGDCGS